MTKRADGKFERVENDFYPTPEKAVLPLLQHLTPKTRFYEPCAGDGSLSQILVENGHVCMGMSDKNPRSQFIVQKSIDEVRYKDLGSRLVETTVITNPPWDRPTMHRLLNHFLCLAPMWLLLEADWLFTKQSGPFMFSATDIVPIGRVRWIAGSAHDGFDNCCWVRFEMFLSDKPPTVFHPRTL